MTHRIAAILFTLFVLIHDPAGDRAASYDGISQAAVAALIGETGFSFDFVDAPTYAAFVIAHQPVPPTPAELLALYRSVAIDELNIDPQPPYKLQRAAVMVLIDEVNTLRQRDRDRTTDVAASTSLADLKSRWAARSSLADRTVAQAKTAIQAKINSGSAD